MTKEKAKEKEAKGFLKDFFKKKPKKADTQNTEDQGIKAGNLIPAETPKPAEPIKKEKALKSPRKVNKRKLFGGILATIMLAILISVGYLLFQKAFKAQPIAKLLPTDSTVALIEINANFEHNQLLKTFNLLKNHPEFSKEKLIEQVEKYFSVNYTNDLKPWIGRQIGMAVLNSKSDGKIAKIYFAEVLDQQNALNFFGRYHPTENVYANKKTFKVDGPFYLTYIDDYLVFSETEQDIYDLIDFQSNKNEKLYNSPKYRKIDNNLPLNRTAFLYLDSGKINSGFLKQFPFINSQGLSAEVLYPILKLFDAEGVCLIAMEDAFSLQSFISLGGDTSKNSEYLSLNGKYKGNLAQYLPPDTLAFWGGENIEHQIKRFTEIIGGGKATNTALVDKVLQNYAKQYFGDNLSFKDEILPLFSNEFSISIEPIANKNVYKLMLKLDNPETQISKLHEIANQFATVAGVFDPKVVEHKLPDGTISKEIVATPEEILKNESTYQDFTIYELQMGKQGWGIYYTVLDDVVIIATDLVSVKNSIDIAKNKLAGLKSTSYFASSLEPVLKSSDEITYFNLEKILPIIFKEKDLPDYLKIISTFSSGRNYFNDGVVTINYVHIK